jgi:hypothetical protein
MDYKYIDVSEKELEHLIRRYADKIGDGMKFIDHQKRTERGPLDVLFVDSGNALAIAELKINEDDNMLFQGIDYYDNVSKDIVSLASSYKKSNINIDPAQTPRLLLIAPSFSVNIVKRCTWINIPISLFSYQCMQIENSDDKILTFQEKDIPSIPKRKEVTTKEEKYNYITDNTAKERFIKMIDIVKGIDNNKITIDNIQDYISVKSSGTLIAYFEPKRNFFRVETYDNDDVWKSFKISSDDDMKDIFNLINISFEKTKK